MDNTKTLLQPARRAIRRARTDIRMWRLNREARLFLDPDAFIGARIIIIAPGETVDCDMSSVDLTEYDYVVRMNRLTNATATAPGSGDRARTDILFHNLAFGGERGAELLESDALARQRTSLIVFPHASEDFVSRKVLSEIRTQRRRLGLAVEMPPFNFYSRLRHDLEGVRPTTGLVATTFFLSSPVDHLMLAGFTFFRTAYKTGYNDLIRTEADARRWAVSGGRHDPERERRLLRNRIANLRSKGRNVSLGPNVERHLYSEDLYSR